MAQNKVEGSQFKLEREVILLHRETREEGVVVWVLAARIKGLTWEEEIFFFFFILKVTNWKGQELVT